MAGDRARVSYDPSRKWRGLIAQQGRVTVEADWNEAAAIGAERDRRLTLDVVGAAGTPDDGYGVKAVPAGAAPGPTPGDLIIGRGTLYLGGERLDLDRPVTYSTQSDWLDHSTDPLWVPPAVPSSTGTSYELVYLLASEQEVSAVEDPALADVALGGPDTMQRQRIRQHFVRHTSQYGDRGEAWNALVGSLAGQGLQFDATSMMVESTATLRVSFTAPGSPDPSQPAAPGGYLGAENQLIRVMVTSVSDGVPTIVWGFDDASFLYRVRAATSNGDTRVALGSSPVDSFHFPVSGQAVELLRDAVELAASDYIASPAGFVSTLTAGYDPASMSLVVSGEPPGDYLSGATPQLYLRVWQATAAAPAGHATPLGDTGVAVTLTSADGSFHVGDFWRFALRPIQPAIVYPARYLTAPQPPDGPRTWACPLAVLTWTGGSATSASCVPPFFSLVTPITAGGGCTVDVKPSDVDNGASLQALLNHYANLPPVTVCLEPGTYTLPAPLQLGAELNGITLQACQRGAVLQAGSHPGTAFANGLIQVNGGSSVTIRGIALSAPLTPFPNEVTFPVRFAANENLLDVFRTGLGTAIGISAASSPGLTVEDCTFSFPDPGQANVFITGILASGAIEGIEITGCTFQAANPQVTTTPFFDVATGRPVTAPYQLTLGYLQVPGNAGDDVPANLLHDATIEKNRFLGVTVPVLAMARLGTLRVDQNTIRNAYGGLWFVSADPGTVTSQFDSQPVGNQGLLEDYRSAGIAALRDGIFVIAAALGWALATIPAHGKETDVLLWLDFHDCQVELIVGDNSGAALLVVDLIVDPIEFDTRPVLLHGNQLRGNFPLGETVLAAGVSDAAVTANIVTNYSPVGYSMVLNPAATGPHISDLDPPSAMAAVTGNVFRGPTLLPPRAPANPLAAPLPEWNALNAVSTVLPVVTRVHPASGAREGGTKVTVTGSGFDWATAVAFGSRQVAISPNNISQDSTEITVNSPLGHGTVNVTVTTPAGASVAAPADQFTYNELYLFYQGVGGPTTKPLICGTSVDLRSWDIGEAAVPNMGAPPAVVAFNNALYCFYLSSESSFSNQPLYCVSSADGSWEVEPQQTNLEVRYTPALVVFNNTLYCFYEYLEMGENPRLHYAASTNGTVWSEGAIVPGSVNMQDGSSPALTVFNNELCCFYVGSDNHLCYVRYDGTSWNSGTVSLGQDVTLAAGPALAVFNNTLYCFYVGPVIDGKGPLWYTSFTSATFDTGSPHPVPEVVSASGSASLVAYGNELYCFYQAESVISTSFYYASSANLTDWTRGQVSIPSKSGSPVVIAW
jgi:hypothetical protein